jgi:hypothetical protein
MINAIGTTAEIVRTYMKTGTTNGQIDKRAVAGTLLSSIEFSTVSINGIETNDIFLSPSAEIRITLKGKCLHDLEYFRTGLTILNNGVKLFSIHDKSEPEPIKKGNFSVEFVIQKYMLRPGDYTLSVYGHDNGNNRKGTDWIYGNEILTFTIMEEWDAINDSHNEGIINVLNDSMK